MIGRTLSAKAPEASGIGRQPLGLDNAEDRDRVGLQGLRRNTLGQASVILIPRGIEGAGRHHVKKHAIGWPGNRVTGIRGMETPMGAGSGLAARPFLKALDCPGWSARGVSRFARILP
jgi:hypothetical protein